MKWLTGIVLLVFHTSAMFGISPYDGLCGEELFYAVRASASGLTSVDNENIWQSLAEVDGLGNGTIMNLFSEIPIAQSGNGIAPEGCSLFTVLPTSYWGEVQPPLNLVNIFATPLSECEQQRDYPPIFNRSGVTTTYNNGIWGTGTYSFAPGYEINCYIPPKGFEGDFARIVMMMVAYYPCSSWTGNGNNICMDNRFPVFQKYYLRDLLEMNDSDPVDEREAVRNKKIAEIQGVGNPFVEYPDLAEHIWGKDSEKPFHSGDEQQRIPIKPTYTSTDKRFYCYSPHLPGDVIWFSIDGIRYNGDEYVPLEQLGNGRHLVRYQGENFSGSVTIEIDR